jgi:flavin-dependent dehydrogenase
MTHALVIGGGLAGASLATLLARAGRDVTLVEREATPVDKVCGEFLSHEAARYLAALGLDLAALGAVPVETLRLCERRGVATVQLPFCASSLSRRILDEALIGLARDAGATIRRGIRVTGLERLGSRFRARFAEGMPIDADSAFLATGKHDLRGLRRPPGLQNDLLAFKVYWRLGEQQARELDRHVELYLFDGGYAGLSPVEGGRANLCLAIRRGRFAALGHRWDRLLEAMRADSPILDARLTSARLCSARPLAIAAIPYGYIQRSADAVWRLGDQAAVMPSFSGEGMSIALHSAHLAATTFLEGGDAAAFQRRLAHTVTPRVWVATALSHGLVQRRAQRALAAGARAIPRLVTAVALGTRLPEAALAEAGLRV